jgi:hypothetical protein
MSSSNKWIKETKKKAEQTNKSFSQTLQDKDHRISYHRQQCDPSKMFRGSSLLPYNHPAMNPILPSLDNSYRTEEQIKAYKDSCNKQKDNHISYLKNLRKNEKII